MSFPPQPLKREMSLGGKLMLPKLKGLSLLRSALALIVGLGLVAFLMRKMEVRHLGELVGQASRPMLLLSAIALCGFYLVRAVRWAVILKWRVSTGPLFLYSSISYLVSSVFPPQVGELLRPGFLRARHRIPYFFALASVGVERLLDVASLFLLAFAALVSMPSHPPGADWLVRTLRTVGIFVAASLFILVIIVLRSAAFLRAVSRLLSFLRLPSRVARVCVEIISSLVAGTAVIGAPLYLCLAVTCSIVLWGMNAASVILVFRALGVDLHFAAIILGFAVLSLGLVIPLMPAYIGQYEALWVLAFLALGARPQARVLASGLLCHVIILLVIALLGLLSLGLMALREGRKEDSPPEGLGAA
jgi:uncharacterized protein (TIRG00374 family)